MNEIEIRRIARELKIPAHIIELDYALSVVLSNMAEGPLDENFVFKGGTAIKKMYYPDARFSKDLDFYTSEPDKENIEKGLRGRFEDKVLSGITFKQLKCTGKPKTAVHFQLSYTAFLKTKASIKFDFMQREAPIIKTKLKDLHLNYPEAGPVAKIQTLDISEILAEKVAAVFDPNRSAPRDLYDIDFLFNKGVRADKNLINKKLEFIGKKFSSGGFAKSVNMLKDGWRKDLELLLPHPIPEFGSVKKEIMRSFQTH